MKPYEVKIYLLKKPNYRHIGSYPQHVKPYKRQTYFHKSDIKSFVIYGLIYEESNQKRLSIIYYQKDIFQYFIMEFSVFASSGVILMIISISRSGLLKSCARFIIERSEIRKKQHDFKSVHFECRMVLFYMIWEKSRL